jgi:hypothetical protein
MEHVREAIRGVFLYSQVFVADVWNCRTLNHFWGQRDRVRGAEERLVRLYQGRMGMVLEKKMLKGELL